LQSEATKVGAGGTEAVDQVDVLAAGQRGEAADAPIVLRLKSRVCAVNVLVKRRLARGGQEDPTWRTGYFKLRCP
jgi:hypothetical protein